MLAERRFQLLRQHLMRLLLLLRQMMHLLM